MSFFKHKEGFYTKVTHTILQKDLTSGQYRAPLGSYPSQTVGDNCNTYVCSNLTNLIVHTISPYELLSR